MLKYFKLKILFLVRMDKRLNFYFEELEVALKACRILRSSIYKFYTF